MDAMNNDGIWSFAELFDDGGNAESGSIGAIVTRTGNDGTVWVQLPGAADETPINGTTAADVKPGDAVTVTISQGRADLVGNSTSRAAGQREIDATVQPVEAMAAAAADVAAEGVETAERAQQAAAEALEAATATGQYFWHDTNGAHVSTDAGDAEGASNSLWNSLGLLIRKAANNLVSITQGAIAFYDGSGNASSNIVAQFGSSGAQIGKTGAANIALDTSKTVFSGANGTELLTVKAANSNASIDHATEYMTVGHLASINSLSTVTTSYAAATKYVESRVQDSGNIAKTEAQISNTGVSTWLAAQDNYGSARIAAETDLNGGSLVRLYANDVYVDTSGAYYQFTGAGNIRNNDSAGNATAYFMKYDATRDTRTQLEHRGACIWQNSSGNLHLANGMSDSAATWEYSFEAGGLYRRTKSGSSWSGWTKLA